MLREIQIDEKIIKRNKIPILIKDKHWRKLFNENSTKNMKRLSDKLEKLISEEKEITKLLKEANKEKKMLMNKILKLSDEANSNNNTAALDALENTRNKILEVNDRIDELQFRLEMLPKEIYDTNLELLKETIAISYEDIIEGRKRVSYLDKEIKDIRKKLGEMWEEKFTKENRINDLYLYLHGTLGHEETDKLDRKFL
ncbi:coiled-coil domain-containing protein [Paramaledivibacter caminithermalis]|jgi:ATP-dependent Lon protease|uniref:Uncharacterized protein n=1 Tax=Paramaledivibacter caminithermalis (strain DSM 15212 / CIP 107654 / DViRD3) TaxID=1121301 RepID=A0A1M6KRV7_PARC5|nr:hypothetical protein [Paramaledivibacter caminithermalis]SHJ61641.1 hypothetical protein SAMN02745912_00503 [Paramaledivibacter caminithermalis DSM 15212]